MKRMTTRDRKPGEGLADRRSPHPFGMAGAGSARDVQSGSTAWHGVTLTHRGDEIGVVSQVTRSGEPAVAVLHALGGISHSLEYAVPETAIVGG